MANCDRMATCSYFRRISERMPTTVRLFKQSYCQNNFKNCARHMLISFLEEKDFDISGELEMKIARISPTLAPNDHENVLALIS